jgi:hypothetical protein
MLPLLYFFLCMFVALPGFFCAVFPPFFGLPLGEQVRFRTRSQAFQVVIAFVEPALAFFRFLSDGPAFLVGGGCFFPSKARVFVLAELDE